MLPIYSWVLPSTGAWSNYQGLLKKMVSSSTHSYQWPLVPQLDMDSVPTFPLHIRFASCLDCHVFYTFCLSKFICTAALPCPGKHFFQYLSVCDSESSSAVSSLYNPSDHLPLSGPGFHQEGEMTSEGRLELRSDWLGLQERSVTIAALL